MSSFNKEDTGIQICAVYPAEPVAIQSAKIVGDTLEVDVRFCGGGALHNFGLCWNGVFLESTPLQVELVVAHDSNNDPCETLTYTKLAFDLGRLKENGRLLLYLRGYGSVEYQSGVSRG